MIDIKISAVLNPKAIPSSGGQGIYLCINWKVRHYINLKLEKIPKNAWSGKTTKWVNTNYQYADFQNFVNQYLTLVLSTVFVKFRHSFHGFFESTADA